MTRRKQHKYFKSPRWLDLRKRALIRDSGKCQCCDKKTVVVQIVHGKQFGYEELGDIATLHWKCRKKFFRDLKTQEDTEQEITEDFAYERLSFSHP